ncbi:hypothetical protein CO057_03135 [Candidatus Uhrbacteria bacterium CG_4_9_14_0_2_um_filter_41_50]|uniref:Histidine phosphatase family protein n=1 Tax=Candidatus Uhrbacteria bacterium CG_4_9_14_0_2_um_filter_41_50 TaxID=1975031 RepID=A0A2M8ENP5_9BACT|nr:MAG: hypothetical protein CO057_03135 [Candidatus Uhrbacteria bacterium CG_4_9_14_0_2_um_filter_41_50]
MKTIYLFRHSTKSSVGDAPLSQEGIHLAKIIGHDKLSGKDFTHLFISPLSRSADTLKSMTEGAGDFLDIKPTIFPPHAVSADSDGMTLWEGVCHEAELAGEDMMQAALQKDSVRAESIAKESAQAFTNWVASMPDDSRVLVVHHSPFLELMVYGLFNKVLPQLQPCEGCVIIENHGKLQLTDA